MQDNGDYEVHTDDCYYKPINNFDDLGFFYHCSSAVKIAKEKYPYKKINGCIHCCPDCHTT